jgi:hypothetical protein
MLSLAGALALATASLFAQTTVTLNGVNYALQSHPRVMLDGAKGTLTTALQNTSGRANRRNPAYVGLQSQVNAYIAGGYRDPMTDYFNWDDAGAYNNFPGANTLNAALLWYAQGANPNDPKGYLAAAKYGIDHALRLVGNSTACNISYTYCGPTVDNGRVNDTDYGRQSLVYIAQAYSIIRSQLTSTERQNFANMMLNDNVAAHNGIDTVACTPQPVTTGTGTLSASRRSATVTITGGTTDQLAVGTVLFNGNNSTISANSYLNAPAAVVTGITSSTTFTVRPAIGASGYPLEYSPAWTTGNCGLIWLMKHHNAAPPLNPATSSTYNKDYYNGNSYVYADNNLNMTALYGYIAVGLALADDDPRAVTLLQQAFNYYYVNMYGYILSADTGFGSSGNAYSNTRTHLFKHIIAEMIQKSVISGPNLMGQYLTREVPFEFMMFYPDYPEGALSFQQPNVSQWGSAGGAYATLWTLPYVDSADPNAPYLNYYLRTTRHDYTAGVMGSTANSYETAFAYIFMDPEQKQTNISGAPSQYLFNDTQYSTCTALTSPSITCYPNHAYAHVVSRSGWTATDDVSMLETGFTDGTDHSSGDTDKGNGDWGDFRIYRNGAYLLSDDTGSASDHEGSMEQMNSIELGGGGNWAQTSGDTGCPDSYTKYGCDNAPILRWGSTDPTGDGSSRYMYVMTDLAGVYHPALITTAPIRVQRHIMHFKKATYQDYFVVYDDVAPGAATTIAALWHYGLCPFVQGYVRGPNRNMPCLTPAAAISFSGNTVSDTQARSRLNSTFIYPGVSGTLINQSKTYPGHGGFTNRLYSCAGSNGTCNVSATSFEEIVVHQPVNGTSGTMPTLTSPTCTGTRGNCAVTQIADSGYPKVAMFARQGALLTCASFTTTHSGAAQYLLAGLSPGTWTVTVGGTAVPGSPFTVNSADNTLYFESPSGAVSASLRVGATR